MFAALCFLDYFYVPCWYDFLTTFRSAVLSLLRVCQSSSVAHFGSKCSSFCKMNVGTSQRTACASIGFLEYSSVMISNMLWERTRGLIMPNRPNRDLFV